MRYKILLICVILILICEFSYCQTVSSHKIDFYKKIKGRHKKNTQASNDHSNISPGDDDAEKAIEEPNYRKYDEALTKFKIKSTNIDQNSNLVNTKPQASISTSFNHTDAKFVANKSYGNWTFGGAWQQKVTGTDSVASLTNLNGITTGSIISVQLQYTSFKRKAGTFTPGFFVNGKFTYNPVSNKYTADSISLKQTTANNVNMSGKGVLGYNFEALNFWSMSFSLGYENGTSFQANNSSTFYSPFGKTPNYSMNSEIFGAPKYQNIGVVSFSWAGAIVQKDRIANDSVKGYAFAYELYAGYSFSQNKYAILLPLYFIKGTEDKNTALNGGIRFGYSWVPNVSSQPATTGFTAEVFISTPFNFFRGIGEQ